MPHDSQANRRFAICGHLTGGIELGLEWTGGFKTVWQVENDPYAQKVLMRHWPDVGRWDDVRTFPPAPAEDWRCDVICGGFPCQDISNAGKRAGIDGERSGLWREYIRVVRAIRPRFIIVENVAALLNGGIARVLGDLAESGYDAEWSMFSACSMGAPHTRERLFIVSYPNGLLRSMWVGPDRHKRERIQPRDTSAMQGDWMATVTRNAGSVNGIPNWSHRCKCLGNAVVPQVAQWIGERILEANGNGEE